MFIFMQRQIIFEVIAVKTYHSTVISASHSLTYQQGVYHMDDFIILTLQIINIFASFNNKFTKIIYG